MEGGEAAYDAEHALVLCQMHGFRAGTLYLYERLGLYTEVLATHMAAEDKGALLQACGRLAPAQPQLWVDTLAFLGSRQYDCSREVRGSKSCES